MNIRSKRAVLFNLLELCSQMREFRKFKRGTSIQSHLIISLEGLESKYEISDEKAYKDCRKVIHQILQEYRGSTHFNIVFNVQGISLSESSKAIAFDRLRVLVNCAQFIVGQVSSHGKPEPAFQLNNSGVEIREISPKKKEELKKRLQGKRLLQPENFVFSTK